MAKQAVKQSKTSIRLACQTYGISETGVLVYASRALQRFLDDCNREELGTGVDFPLPSERVIHTLDRLIEWRGKPNRLRCD